MSVDPSEPVVTTLVCFTYIRARGCGCSGTRHSLRPLLSRDIVLQSSGASRRENMGLCPVGCLKLNQLHPRRSGGTTRAFVLYSARLLIFLTQTRTSASTSGSTALTSATVMPALMRGSYRMFRMY